MANFKISLLSTGSIYATFPSTCPHIAVNKHGTFYSVQTALDPALYSAQTLKILWLKADGSLIELPAESEDGQRISASQACAVLAFETGEVYAIWSNFSQGGGIAIEKWNDVSDTLTPSRTVTNGVGAMNGKFTAEIDEGRRCLYVTGSSGYFFVFDEWGHEALRQQIIATAYDAQYTVLSLSEHGALYFVWCSATESGPTSYDNIAALMTPNPRPQPGVLPSWSAGPWAKMEWVTLPIDADVGRGGNWLVSGEQAYGMNSLLVGAHIADEDRLFALYAQGPRTGDKLLGPRATLAIEGLDWSQGYTAICLSAAYRKRPLRGRSIIPRGASGAVIERASGLYVISHDHEHNLVALQSKDGGKNWHDYAKTAVPGNPADTLHYVNAYTGGHKDEEVIIGVAVDEKVTADQWISAATISPHATDVYRWTLTV